MICSFSNTFNLSSSNTPEMGKQLNKDNNVKHKKNTNIYNPVNLFKMFLFYTAVLALQKAIPFKDGNIIVHSFLDTNLIYKHKWNFCNSISISKTIM
jgi:hypothetical protein